MSSEIAKQLGAKGGKKTWKDVTKEERSRRMRELALKRWGKKKGE